MEERGQNGIVKSRFGVHGRICSYFVKTRRNQPPPSTPKWTSTRTAGHAAGAETFRTIATYCKDIGLDYLTVYAFSTENWKRPQEEVGAIMGLLRKYLHEAIQEMAQDHIKLQFFGDLTSLDPELYQLCQETRKISEGYDGFQVNVCLNYGGRDGNSPRTAWKGRPSRRS